MKPIEFPEQNVIIAKDQPQYKPLPSYKYPDDPEGTIVSCWSLSWKERITLLLTGKLWVTHLTFNNPMMPHLISIEAPWDNNL